MTDMGGSCSCDWEGGCSSDFWVPWIVKARKVHRCCECREAILPGEKYERIGGKSDGEMFTVKTCLPCAGIRRDFVPCLWFGDLRDDMWKLYGFDYLTNEHNPRSMVDDDDKKRNYPR